MDPLARVESLLAEVIGLDPASIGRRALEVSVRNAMQAARAASLDEFVASLTGSAAMERLVDAAVVPESFFFRDAGSFEFLRRFARDEWRGNVLRVLSIPCAAGEEPYSIAMALREAGLPPSRARIDAVDIRAGAVAAAEAAVYRPSAFRGEEALRARTRWFEPASGNRFALGPAFRGSVRFRRGNLLDPALLAGETFDVIFCKNLLIYLHDDARRFALAQLDRLLAPEGKLFVGPSEVGWVQNAGGFASAGDARAIVLARRARPRQEPDALKPRPADHERRARLQPAPPVQQPHPTLDDVRSLAGSGHIREASVIARDLLRMRGPSEELLALLGLLAYARGEDGEGEQWMDRALYLNPRNVEALTFLALARERSGHGEAAALLRERAQRAEAESHA